MHKIMIHPIMTKVFSNNDEIVFFFSWVCSKISSVDKLEEFIKWHFELSNQVIEEIVHIQKLDFLDHIMIKKWAKNYLDEYEDKIRAMRHTSNLVFSRFHELKNKEFNRIMLENKDHEKEITEMMNIFLNRKELLIGKLIFAYRETWFLAKHIHNPDFKLGTVKAYKDWADENISNLKDTRQSLEIIYREISKWKE